MTQRNTRQKEVILDVVRGEGKHRTAEEILIAARHIDPHISQATVYRHLNRFCMQGELRRISGEGWTVYDGNTDPHDHLLCRECGTLIDVPVLAAEEMMRSAEEMTGARVFGQSVLYQGICRDCLNRQK